MCSLLQRGIGYRHGIKNKDGRRRQVGVAPEDTWEWAGHCGHLYTWVGPSFLRACTSLERAWGRGYACTCSQCNQRRTRVRVEALKQGWVGLALLTHGTGGAGPCKAQNGGRSKWCTPLLTRDNFSTFRIPHLVSYVLVTAIHTTSTLIFYSPYSCAFLQAIHDFS